MRQLTAPGGAIPAARFWTRSLSEYRGAPRLPRGAPSVGGRGAPRLRRGATSVADRGAPRLRRGATSVGDRVGPLLPRGLRVARRRIAHGQRDVPRGQVLAGAEAEAGLPLVEEVAGRLALG